MSVTPAIGARTVAGQISTPPKLIDGGTGVPARATASAAGPELSQYLRISLNSSGSENTSSAVREGCNIPQPEQTRVGSDKGEVEDHGSGCEKTIGRVVVEFELVSGEHDVLS